MITTVTPWLLHDAEIALWSAWKDGMPMTGPGRGRQDPLFVAKASLSIAGSFDAAAAAADAAAGPMAAGIAWQISAEFPDGAVADEFGRVLARIHPGGYRILTVRFLDEASGHWTKLSFFYVVSVSDNVADSGQIMARTVALRSTFRQERIGSATPPDLDPVVIGEVDWICGPRKVTALEYDPTTETWTSLPANETGVSGSRYVLLTPITDEHGSDVLLAAYLPRVTPDAPDGDKLARASIQWQNTAVLRIGNQASEFHHGLVLQAGHALQALAITEPLVTYPQHRVIEEPVIVFRFLRRVYATIGHGVLAVPRLTENEDPPVTHDPAFRIAIPGDPNPATGQSGLTLLPNGAWIDGTLSIHP